MTNKGISRREFLKISAATTGAAAMASISPSLLSAQDMTYNEAPMLAEMVAAGDLPPLNERLPLNPKVQPVYDSIGQYGGTWRRGFRGASDRFGVHTTLADHLLEMYQEDGGDLTLIPNVAESYEVNDDATEFTWNLREGHKWSDGVELSSENAIWWYENVLLNEQIAPNQRYDNVRQQQNLTGITANGQWSFITSYSVPNPTLPLGVVRGEAWGLIGGLNFMVPHHYLQDFHADFVEADVLQEVVDSFDLQTWEQLWLQGPIAFFINNPDLPIVGAWPVTTPVPTDQLVQTRNAYYFQVDEEGNQLPYIDRITHTLYENQESFNLLVISGEVDVQFRHVQLRDFPLLKENEEGGDYTVKVWISDSTSGYRINPEPRNDDGEIIEEQAVITRQADLRRALSLAINREELNLVVFNGLSNPSGWGPIQGSPIYDPKYDQMWADYDLDRANELLDGIGLDQRDGNGFRQRPDGETFVLRMDVDASPGTANSDMHELVRGYWEAVGVRTVINPMERSLRETVQFSYRWSVILSGASNTSVPLSFDLYHEGPGGGYRNWRDDPSDPLAAEPPADSRFIEMIQLIEEAYTMTDFDAAHAKLQEAMDIFYDEVYAIGTVGGSSVPVVVSNRVRNVPDSITQANALMQINNAQPHQFWIAE